MKIDRFIKFLNNTELGRGNTNESYMYIKKDFEIDFLFEGYDNFFSIKDNSEETYPLRLTKGNEKRIVGLGTYYRNYNLDAGDGVVLERVEHNGKIDFMISHIKKSYVLVFMKIGMKGFEVLNETEKIAALDFTKKLKYNGSSFSFSLTYKSTQKKQINSPDVTDFYLLELRSLDDNSLFELKDVDNGDMLEIIKNGQEYLLKKIEPYFVQRVKL